MKKIDVSKRVEHKTINAIKLQNRKKLNKTNKVQQVVKHIEVKRQEVKKIIKPNNLKIEKPKIQILNRHINNSKIIKKSQPLKSSKNQKVKNYDHKINDIKDVGVGKILVIIACGPSINEIDVREFTNKNNLHIMVVNKIIPEINPEYWVFCDHSQYELNKDSFNSYGKLTITSDNVRAFKNNQIVIKSNHGSGVKRNLTDGYIIGRSTVYANIQTALWMNYDEIYIFGVDMCEVGGKLHHNNYGINPTVSHNERKKRFTFESDHYNKMAEVLPEAIRKKIYFCSSYNNWPFVNKFNKLGHLEAVDRIMQKCI